MKATRKRLKILGYLVKHFHKGALKYYDYGEDDIRIVDLNGNEIICRYGEKDNGLNGVQVYIKCAINGGTEMTVNI